jgi:hypothetical protein
VEWRLSLLGLPVSVIPAQAGIQPANPRAICWIPAFAAMTSVADGALAFYSRLEASLLRLVERLAYRAEANYVCPGMAQPVVQPRASD